MRWIAARRAWWHKSRKQEYADNNPKLKGLGDNLMILNINKIYQTSVYVLFC